MRSMRSIWFLYVSRESLCCTHQEGKDGKREYSDAQDMWYSTPYALNQQVCVRRGPIVGHGIRTAVSRAAREEIGP